MLFCYLTLYGCFSLLIHLLVEKHWVISSLGPLWIQWGWTFTHTGLCGQIPSLLSGKTSEWTGWIIWWVYILNFYEISKLFFKAVVPFYILTSNIWSFSCSTSLPGHGSLFSSSCFSNDGMASHGFSLHFSNDSWCQASFHPPFLPHLCLFCVVSVQVTYLFCFLIVGLFVFLLVSFQSSLCILEIGLLSNMLVV